MLNNNKQQIQVLQSQVAELQTQVKHLTDAILKINRRKQAEQKVKDKLTPSVEELATKHELDFLRRRVG